MSTDKNYRMDPETKRMLSLFKFKGPDARAEFKKTMIKGQTFEMAAKRSKLREISKIGDSD